MPIPTEPKPFAVTAATVAAFAAALALLAYLFWLPTETCDGLECLGSSLFAAAFSIVVVPSLAALTLWFARVPRAVPVGLAMAFIGHGLAWLVTLAQTVRHDFGDDVPLAPGYLYVAAGIIAGLASLLLVGRGSWSGWVRLSVAGGLASLGVAGFVAYESELIRHVESEIAAAPVSLYLPDFGEGTSPSYATAWSGRVQIQFQGSPGSANLPDRPQVTLVPVSGRGLCSDAHAAGFYSTSGEATCRADGDVLVADAGYPSGYGHFVGVRRGETLLVAEVGGGGVEDQEVVAVLRDAPRSDPAELARLRYRW